MKQTAGSVSEMTRFEWSGIYTLYSVIRAKDTRYSATTPGPGKGSQRN